MTQRVRQAQWWMVGPDPGVDRLFDRLYGPWLSALRDEPTGAGRWTPACEVYLRDGDLVVRMELPGIDAEKDVQISVEDGVLYMRGERRKLSDRDVGGYYRREWAYGSFQRGVPLPDSVAVEQIRASYAGGVLEVVVPKYRALSEPRRIPVQVGAVEVA